MIDPEDSSCQVRPNTRALDQRGPAPPPPASIAEFIARRNRGQPRAGCGTSCRVNPARGETAHVRKEFGFGGVVADDSICDKPLRSWDFDVVHRCAPRPSDRSDSFRILSVPSTHSARDALHNTSEPRTLLRADEPDSLGKPENRVGPSNYEGATRASVDDCASQEVRPGSRPPKNTTVNSPAEKYRLDITKKFNIHGPKRDRSFSPTAGEARAVRLE